MTHDTMQLRPASPGDTPLIMPLMEQAKAQMRREGSNQWDETYPVASDIDRDIAQGNGYVLTHPDTGEILCYGAIVFTGEPTYAVIRDGAWLSDGPYVVVHRLAVADSAKGRGVATRFMQLAEDMARERGVKSFRADTKYDNVRLHRIFDRLGMTYCGIITLAREGQTRKAFEKVL